MATLGPRNWKLATRLRPPVQPNKASSRDARLPDLRAIVAATTLQSRAISSLLASSARLSAIECPCWLAAACARVQRFPAEQIAARVCRRETAVAGNSVEVGELRRVGSPDPFGGIPPKQDRRMSADLVWNLDWRRRRPSWADQVTNAFTVTSGTITSFEFMAVTSGNISVGDYFGINSTSSLAGSFGGWILPADLNELSKTNNIFGYNFGGASGVTFTATTTIPEPSTWAMMLLGFAGLGYAGYRRAKGDRRPAG